MVGLKKKWPFVSRVKSDCSVHGFSLPLTHPPSLSVLVLPAKGAGGKPFPLALAERVTSLEYVWPEFTTGEYTSEMAPMKYDLDATDTRAHTEGSQRGTVGRNFQDSCSFAQSVRKGVTLMNPCPI